MFKTSTICLSATILSVALAYEQYEHPYEYTEDILSPQWHECNDAVNEQYSEIRFNDDCLDEHGRSFCENLANQAIQEQALVCDEYVPIYEHIDRRLQELEDMKAKVLNFKREMEDNHDYHLGILSLSYTCEMNGDNACENNKQVTLRRHLVNLARQ